MATSGTTGTAKGSSSPTAPSWRPRRPPPSVWASIPAGTGGWPACRSITSGALSVVTRSLLTGTPVTVLPGFDRDAVRAAGGPDVLVSLVPTALGPGRRRPLPHRGARRVGPAGRPPGQRGHHLRTDRDRKRRGLRRRTPRRRRGGHRPATPARSASGGPCSSRGYRDGSRRADAGRLVRHWRRRRARGRRPAARPRPVDRADHQRRRERVARPRRSRPVDPPLGGRGRRRRDTRPRMGPAGGGLGGARRPAALPVLDELRRLVAETVAPFAAPRQVVLVDQLPRTSIGKVQRGPAAAPIASRRPMEQYPHDGLTFDVSDTGPADGRAVILLHGFPEDRHCWEQPGGRRSPTPATGPWHRTSGATRREPGPPGGAPTRLIGWRATSWPWRTQPGPTASMSSATTGARRWPGPWRAAPGPGPESDGPLGPPSPGHGGSPLPQSPATAVVVHAVLPDPGLPELALSWSGAAVSPTAPAHRPRRRLRPPVCRPGRHPGALTGPLNWYRALPFDRPPRFGPVAVPTLFVWGERDRFVTRVAAEPVRPPRHRALHLRAPAGGGPLAALRLGPRWPPPLLRHLGDRRVPDPASRVDRAITSGRRPAGLHRSPQPEA